MKRTSNTTTDRSKNNGFHIRNLGIERLVRCRNRRIRKTVQRLSVSYPPPPSPPVETREWDTVETRTFVWDGNNIVLEKVVFADGTARTFEYFWGMDKSGTEQGAGGVEGLLAVSMDGVFYIPCYDHNGNIVRYVSEIGGIVAQYIYDPYGNMIESCGSLADVFSFGFSTKYHDRETGMVGYQRRFYHPDLGRWLNRDPIEESGGFHLYAFCSNNPIMYIDSYGYSIVEYLPFTSTILSLIDDNLGHIPGESPIDYSFVSPLKCKCNIEAAEKECSVKVEKESLQYAADFASGALVARIQDIVITVATIKANAIIASAFAIDGTIGLMINLRVASKIMAGTDRAKKENCSCSQYGYH